MENRIFVDEAKAKGYLLVAASLTSDTAKVFRSQLRGLVLPGQRALHMKNERDPRRHAIADTIARMTDLGLRVTIYDSGKRYRNEKERRARCLDALVRDVPLDTPTTVTFDRDESLERWDRQQMIELTRATGNQIGYGHATRNGEMLLAIPDAIAWCWARGGDWRRRVAPTICAVKDV